MTAPLRVVSLFSGVGGFDLGLERAGMVTVAQVEWDKKCQSVLARHWPNVPRWGDVSDVKGADLPDCDLVAFGSPCQDLSVAGKRAGMVEGETRSGLFYEAVRIIKELQHDGRGPAWVVWENVVGALSSNGGADFGAVLNALGGLGAVDVQWRVLDAQWFGVPQRRRRVFVVARLDPRAVGREQVLPLGARVRRNPAARGEAGAGTPAGPESGAPGSRVPDVAGTLGGGSGDRGWPQDVERMTFIPETTEVSALTSTGVGTCGADDNQAQAGHLVPMTDDDGATERERDDSRPPADGRDLRTGRAPRRPERTGRVQRPDHPDTAAAVTAKWAKGTGGPAGDECQNLVAVEGTGPVVAPTLTAYNLDSRSPQSEEAQRIVAAVYEAKQERAAAGGDLPPEGVYAFGRQEDRLAGTVYEDEVPGLTTSKTYAVAVPADPTPILEVGARTGTSTDDPRAGMGIGKPGDPMFTLQATKQHEVSTPDLAVRRLTPRECERLMGWPDDWTRWAADGSEVADSSRYRMCGNGVASPVAEWIGRCIVTAHQEVEA